MVKVIQKNINDISYSTFRLVDIFDPLMMYYIVKNSDGSYENVSVDKVKKTHKYKSFRKKYNDIKELDDVAIVDKKLRVKHKSNDEYKYVFLEDGNKLRIMISSMIGGGTRKITDFLLKRKRSENDDKRREKEPATSIQPGTPLQPATPATSEQPATSIQPGTPLQPATPATSEQPATSTSSQNLTEKDDDSNDETQSRLRPTFFDLKKNTYNRFLNEKGIEEVIGKYIADTFFGENGVLPVFNRMMESFFDKYYKYKDTTTFKKLVLNNILFYIQEITRLKLLAEHIIEIYTLSGGINQCGGIRNEVCDNEDPIFCNLRDRLVRDIIHDFKGQRSKIPHKTIDTYVQMFSKNGSEISFENPENYTYGSTKDSLADLEKSYREVIMRKCLNYDLLHFIITDVKDKEMTVKWETSMLYKVYGDKSKDIISYTTDNNISNKIQIKIPVDKLDFYYTVAGIFDPEMNNKRPKTILEAGLLSVDQSKKQNPPRLIKIHQQDNLKLLELDLRIMNSISIKYSEYSFMKRPRTDENLEKFLKNVYLHFERLEIANNKFTFKCKFVHHYGNVDNDDYGLSKTKYNKSEKNKYFESVEFEVPQALFTVTNVDEFINVSKTKSKIDDMLSHLKKLLIKVHGDDPALKSNMFSRLYILSLKSFGDYIQFEFVKECNKIMGKNANNSENLTGPTRLFITSTDVIAYSQGICNNVPILADMINPDISWLFKDISKKFPSIPDDMEKYLNSSERDKALNFKHIGLFYEGNMKLEKLISTNSKLNKDNWENTMNTVVNTLNKDKILISKPNINSIDEFRNWISSGIALPIAGQTFYFSSTFFNENTDPFSIPLRSIHKYVNDIMNLAFVDEYIQTKIDATIYRGTFKNLKDLRDDIALYYDVYLKNQESNTTEQILIVDADASKNNAETEQRRSSRLGTIYYKINPSIKDFDYVNYLVSYQKIHTNFTTFSTFLNELQQLEDTLNSVEESESIERSIRLEIMKKLAEFFLNTINEELVNDFGKIISEYDTKRSQSIREELSVNTILQQLKDIRQLGNVQVNEKDFLFNTEFELTNFISVHRNMKKLFTKFKSGYKKVQEFVNTEDKLKDPSSQNGEKGFGIDHKALLKVLPNMNLFESTGTQEQTTKQGNQEGHPYNLRKRQRTNGGTNKSAYMKSLKKADEDLAKYLKKKCSLKIKL